MAKLDKCLSRLIPSGPLKDILKSAYYQRYYNYRHAKKNGFRMYYDRRGYYEFVFSELIRFKCYENIADDLERSMPGYLAEADIKEGDTVIDCGACVGEFTLYAAKAAGKRGKVVAFEPDKNFFEKLERNILLNSIKNVILIEKGVWSKVDTLRFSGGSQSGNLYDKNLTYNTESYDVPVTTLDHELEKIGLGKVDFIKMDVEGAEVEAIKGACGILEKSSPRLAIASYHALNGQHSYVELEKVLKRMGYRTKTDYPAHLTTYGCRDYS